MIGAAADRATLAVVVPRSHKKFVSLLESGAGPEDMQASLMSPEALADGIVAELKGGDCFLWDSRTSHGASPRRKNLRLSAGVGIFGVFGVLGVVRG